MKTRVFRLALQRIVLDLEAQEFEGSRLADVTHLDDAIINKLENLTRDLTVQARGRFPK